jgi:hypothetical protein
MYGLKLNDFNDYKICPLPVKGYGNSVVNKEQAKALQASSALGAVASMVWSFHANRCVSVDHKNATPIIQDTLVLYWPTMVSSQAS